MHLPVYGELQLGIGCLCAPLHIAACVLLCKLLLLSLQAPGSWTSS
jgi:hypothetical protein